MVNRILCVAEKPSIAKAVAHHLGSTVSVSSTPRVAWLKNYEFEFTFNPPWGRCQVVMTSVAGHLSSTDFPDRYRWHSCRPVDLFEAPLETIVKEDKKPIEGNIQRQARSAQALYIWTDCDREGEHIGSEIRDVALKANSRLEVKRAKFSNIERAHVIQAAKRPVDLDERQAEAVAARIELDLRFGAAFTRMQTDALKPLVETVQDIKAISYGSCQFPTLGFVVDRYFRVRNFKRETFWKIHVVEQREGIKVSFNWRRVHLFDRMAVVVLFERCINSGKAKVTRMDTKPTSKWKPLPLTTVELQKVASRFLRMDSQRVMQVAEALYQRGFISYPRTETDQFDRGIDLKAIIDKQTPDEAWGTYAQSLIDGAFNQPRSGRNNDQAHPPIHPVNHVRKAELANDDERRVYEFVVRRFLACCSEDAKGATTTVELTYGGETFAATGLLVQEQNYLVVYTYDKWTSSQKLPNFELGETFVPTEARVVEGHTSPPGYLTEPELIALMDANGIGTDATMAEHIAKIQEREYVYTNSRGNAAAANGVPGEEDPVVPATRGGRGGRGRGRGRGAASISTRGSSNNTVKEFIPSTLGVALIEGYDQLGLETSLAKPFLRKEMELQMKAICAGQKTRNDVVQMNVEKYREVFLRTMQQMGILKASVRKYVLGQGP